MTVLAPPATTIADLAVGFADVCGFTTLSRFIDLPHLELVVASFEELCDDALEGRAEVIKAVGDGVLYAMPSADDAVDVALGLVAAAAERDLLPPVRVGLAFGSVLVRRCDCFGPVVNLASRLVATAPAGAVVASSAVRDNAGSSWSWRCVPPRELKGIGAVEAWEVTGARQPTEGDGPRSPATRVHWSIPDPELEDDTDEAAYPAFERTPRELETRIWPPAPRDPPATEEAPCSCRPTPSTFATSPTTSLSQSASTRATSRSA